MGLPLRRRNFLTMGIVWVLLPFRWVIDDVLPGILKFPFPSYYVFVVTSLPELT